MLKTNEYDLYGIKVTEYSLPPAIGDIEVTRIDKCGSTLRIFVTIKDKSFRRLHDLASRRLPIVWAEGEIGGILEDKENNELESIFKAYCEQLNGKMLFNDKKLINA